MYPNYANPFLWMIADVATSQNWEKRKEKEIP
jgi:hypothetical protein